MAVDVRRIESLRRQGRSWAEITRETGVSKGTAQRAIAEPAQNPYCRHLPKCLIRQVPKERNLTAQNQVIVGRWGESVNDSHTGDDFGTAQCIMKERPALEG